MINWLRSHKLLYLNDIEARIAKKYSYVSIWYIIYEYQNNTVIAAVDMCLFVGSSMSIKIQYLLQYVSKIDDDEEVIL